MTGDIIQAYERMAKLSLDAKTREWAVNAVNGLEKSFRKLEQIDTANVVPLVTVLETKNVTRADIAIKINTREELMSAAPEEYDGYFQVPKIIE